MHSEVGSVAEARISISNMKKSILSSFLPFLAFLIAACSPADRSESSGLSPEQESFWATVSELCGNAYEGVLADATPFYDSFRVDRIRIHVRACSDDLIHISLHLDDNHSRNLLLSKADGTLRLKHDHRNRDGTEESITQYGGDAPKPGLEHRQIFVADAHTASILPHRHDNFWYIHLMDENTLSYGNYWPEAGNSIRMEFDLANPIDPPSAPWGYE